MADRPTVYDVAERAGVSIATVSFAFRKPERVRPATRELVLAAARELGYVPNGAARGLAQRRTACLGLYAYHYLLPQATRANVGDEEDAFWRLFPLYVDEVQRGMELECWEQGYALMLGGGAGDDRAGDSSIAIDIAGRVDGLAVFAQTVPAADLAAIAKQIPVVEVSEPSADDGLSYVSVDNRGGMRALTEHLIAEHGHQRLVFVGQTRSQDVAERFKGFRSALRAHDLPPQKAALTAPGDVEQEAAQLCADWTRDGLPQAVVCATDQQALAVVDQLQSLGVRVPEDVAVTGFDGIVAGRLSQPALTTVRQPMEELGRTAVTLLVDRLNDPDAPASHRKLPVQLLLRQSCGC
jgi:LacI family transcriptional regulator